MQDVSYVRDGPPETTTLHAHARATTTSAPASRSVRGTNRAGLPGGRGGGTVAVARPGEGPRVMRSVFLPNEKVDSLLLTIESLRAQLAKKESEIAELTQLCIETQKTLNEQAAEEGTPPEGTPAS